jgi:hypothetical protein
MNTAWKIRTVRVHARALRTGEAAGNVKAERRGTGGRDRGMP